MQATAKWIEGKQFLIETGSGATIVVDGPVDHGGGGRGARPMELVLAGLAGCSSFDLMEILQKSRQQVTDCRIEVAAKRADAVPAVFTDIELTFVITGVAVKQKQVERAVELAVDKYCSVATMLVAGGVKISHSFQIIEQA